MHATWSLVLVLVVADPRSAKSIHTTPHPHGRSCLLLLDRARCGAGGSIRSARISTEAEVSSQEKSKTADASTTPTSSVASAWNILGKR